MSAIRLQWLFALISILALSCTEPLSYTGSKDDPVANFEHLSKIVKEHYCFFSQKNIDWDSVTDAYRGKITAETDRVELFVTLGAMLDELRDGHVNLSAPFATSYYKKWWSDYPQDFNDRVLQEYYLKFGGFQIGLMQYVIFLPDTVGYVRIPSFSYEISPVSLDYVLSAMQSTCGLILDIRDNGGGYLTNVPEVVGRFIDKKITGGYIRHKTGPGPDDFSEPFELVYKPCSPKNVNYLGKEILVLTNRSCYSAANDFVAMMKELPQVKIVGATTGGGGGLPFTSELPNGWSVRMSASPINDRHDNITEFGIPPSDGFEVHCTSEEFAQGKDAILDYALRYFQKIKMLSISG